jgi:hypothetical protein
MGRKPMQQSKSNNLYLIVTTLLFVFTTSMVLVGCSGKEDATETGVSFSKQIVPILQGHCYECHLPGKPGEVASGLDMSTYDSLMKGTKFGPVIIPGNAVSSTLIILVEGRADPSINMPHGDRPPLRAEDIHLLRQWINEGALNN